MEELNYGRYVRNADDPGHVRGDVFLYDPSREQKAQGYVHSEDTAMIGDRMDTDIIAGIESGLDPILVLTGVTDLNNIKQYPYRPRLILNSIGDIPN